MAEAVAAYHSSHCMCAAVGCSHCTYGAGDKLYPAPLWTRAGGLLLSWKSNSPTQHATIFCCIRAVTDWAFRETREESMIMGSSLIYGLYVIMENFWHGTLCFYLLTSELRN